MIGICTRVQSNLFFNNRINMYKEYVIKVYTNGDKYWYLNGISHREDGPAIELSNGSKYWFLNDKKYSEEEYLKKTSSHVDTCEGKVVEIDGKKYTLVSMERLARWSSYV